MKFSIITPSHNPQYLRTTIESVLEQTVADWELVIVPNGNCVLGDIVPDDPRIRVVPYSGPDNIGAIKRFGFDNSQGDILVELDHDDILHPECLEELGKVLVGEVGFAYSSTVEFEDKGNDVWEPHVYSSYYGWKTRPNEFRGHQLIEMIAFDPTPASVSYIWWSANHVRAWTRNAYYRAGGHDPSFKVGDDHDVVIRSYLTTKFARIDRALYYQRLHSDNTTRVVTLNGEIQKVTHQLYSNNIEKIVLRWAQLHNLPCLDLGGAHGPSQGWEPIDLALGGPDLSKKWPWPDSSIGAIRAYDFLEHLPDKQHVMSEMHRVLVPGGWALTLTPAAPGIGAFADPTHISFWNARTFLYWLDSNLAKYIGNTTVRFQKMRLVSHTLGFNHDFIGHEDIPYVTCDMVALKEGYHGCGEIRI